MREESRIESSFGPTKLAERPDIMRGETTLIFTYSHHIPITVVQAFEAPMHVALAAEI